MVQPSKYLNSLRSGYSFIISAVTHYPFISGMPPAIGIELTNHCNLKCPECPSGAGTMSRERGFMDYRLFRKTVSELKPYLYNANLYFQGEPMMHPAFFDFLGYAAGTPTTVSTNGHFLSQENCRRLAESRLSRLIISLDGLDQATYSSYRKNGNIEKVLQGIKDVSEAVRKASSKMKVEVQVLVNRNNESQIAEIKEFIISSGGRPVLKSMQIYEGSDYYGWMPADKKFSRYYLNDGNYLVRSSLPRRCLRLWFNPVVTWDGRVIPCCFDKDADHVMGNLADESFREIWRGEKFKDFRK
ncbi:MAG: radical SAM/SPASM domain-containing protein, partial [Chloroflexota bacterium]